MNKLTGKITTLTNKDHLSKVSLAVGNQIFHAIVINVNNINPNLVIGQKVFILFKETEVTLSLKPLEHISIDNKIPVIVDTIKKGVLLSRIVVSLEGIQINTVVPAEFALTIQEGMSLIMLIRSNELMLME